MAVWACEIDDDEEEEWREEKRVVITMKAAMQSPVFGRGKQGDMDDSKEGRKGCYCQASLKEFSGAGCCCCSLARGRERVSVCFSLRFIPVRLPRFFRWKRSQVMFGHCSGADVSHAPRLGPIIDPD